TPRWPEDALTVTGAFGRTPVDRSAGNTASSAGVGVGMDRVGPCAEGPGEEPAVGEPASLFWQALRMTLSTTSRAERPWPRRDLANDLNLSNRLSGHGLWQVAVSHCFRVAARQTRKNHTAF